MNINVYIYTYEQPTKLSDDEQSSKKLPWTLKQLTKPAQPIRDHPKPIPHNPKRTQGISFRQALGALFMMFMESLCFYFFLSFFLSVCLSFFLSLFLSCVPFGVPFTPLMRAWTLLSHVFEGNRQDPPILEPIPTDTQFVSFWSPVRPSQCGTEQV